MTRQTKKSVVLIVILMYLSLNIFALVGFIQLRSQIKSLEMEIQMLKDDQSVINWNQKRLTDAVTNWIEAWQMDMFESTAYSPLDDRNGLSSWGDGSVMASGARTEDHIDTAIAVDPRVIPLGTKVWIKGIGWRTALDTGGSIKDKRIDICMRSFDDAIQYGVKEALVIWPRSRQLQN